MMIFGFHVCSPRDHTTNCATHEGVTVAPTRRSAKAWKGGACPAPHWFTLRGTRPNIRCTSFLLVNVAGTRCTSILCPSNIVTQVMALFDGIGTKSVYSLCNILAYPAIVVANAVLSSNTKSTGRGRPCLIFIQQILVYGRFLILVCFSAARRDSSVGIATHYGLEDPGIESRWRQNFPHPSRPALGLTQLPIQWVRVFPGVSGRGVASTTHPI
jgi:hypothetical protein